MLLASWRLITDTPRRRKLYSRSESAPNVQACGCMFCFSARWARLGRSCPNLECYKNRTTSAVRFPSPFSNKTYL